MKMSCRSSGGPSAAHAARCEPSFLLSLLKAKQCCANWLVALQVVPQV